MALWARAKDFTITRVDDDVDDVADPPRNALGAVNNGRSEIVALMTVAIEGGCSCV